MYTGDMSPEREMAVNKLLAVHKQEHERDNSITVPQCYFGGVSAVTKDDHGSITSLRVDLYHTTLNKPMSVMVKIPRNVVFTNDSVKQLQNLKCICAMSGKVMEMGNFGSYFEPEKTLASMVSTTGKRAKFEDESVALLDPSENDRWGVMCYRVGLYTGECCQGKGATSSTDFTDYNFTTMIVRMYTSNKQQHRFDITEMLHEGSYPVVLFVGLKKQPNSISELDVLPVFTVKGFFTMYRASEVTEFPMEKIMSYTKIKKMEPSVFSIKFESDADVI